MLNRRQFLFYGGATVAGVTLGEAGRRALARADDRDALWHHRAPERIATSVCRECPAACGVRVRVVNDVPVKLEGNSLCPIARGRLCANGQAALESYFDPDRLVGPARRVGPRGRNQWERISWEAGMSLLASRLRDPDRSESRRPIAVAAEERGPLADHWSRTWTEAGARVVWTPLPTAARLRPAFTELTGCTADPIFDVEHATYVLSLDAPLVETWLSPVWAQRSYGRFRRAPSRPRGRLVHFESRRSPTARKADEWLPLSADQQIVFAYGLASVILRENREHQEFVASHGGNWLAFQSAVTAVYTPDEVADLTGVPVVTLLRLARELAASAQPVVVVRADAPPPLVEAAFALNGLLGAFDRAGGIFASPQPPVDQPDDASGVLQEVASGRLRPSAIVLRDASVLRGLERPLDLAALDAGMLVVSLSPYLDEVTRVADLILPVHTPLESWHAVVPPTVMRAASVAIARPVVAPRLDTRDVAEVLDHLLDAPAASSPTERPAVTSETVVSNELDRLHAVRRGAPYASAYEIEWLAQLERGGLWLPSADSREEFGRVALEAGGWVDPYFEPGAILHSLRAQQGLTFTLPRGVAAAAVLRVTDQRPALGTADLHAFPLVLVPFVPTELQRSANHNQPVLFEIIGQPDVPPWRVWIELSPDTARDLGVAHGARVHVESPSGAIDAVAVLVGGMAGGTVAVACLPVQADGGRWTRMLSGDARALMDGTAGRTRVRVKPV
jgi:anaerobic selenocysteine-containing dehydrogenase